MATDTAGLLQRAGSIQSTIQDLLQDTGSRAKRRTAAAAIKDLLVEVQDPEDAFCYQYEQIGSAYALRTLLSFGVMESLPTTGSITAVDLATKVKCEPELLVRLMRLLVVTGVLAETAPDTYAHTGHSRVYLRPGYVAFHQIMMDEVHSRAYNSLTPYFATRERRSPEDMKNNPLTYAYGMDGHDWHEIYARSPELLQTLMIAMSATATAVPALGAYPFGQQLSEKSAVAQRSGEVFLIDVGGGNGGITKLIRDTYPELRGKIVVQDMERVVNAIPAGFLPDGMEAMVYDFWAPQTVKAKVYYLRRVMHDWPDKECAQILSNQAAAMDDDAVILISDTIVPERVQRVDTYPYWMDFCMLNFSGRERSAADWQRLFAMSGLELVKIWLPEAGCSGVVEGRKQRK